MVAFLSANWTSTKRTLMSAERESEKDSVVNAVAAAPAGTPFLPAGGGFSKVCAMNGSSAPPTGSDSTVVSGGLTLAGAEGRGAGWIVSAVGTGAAVGAGVGVGTGAAVGAGVGVADGAAETGPEAAGAVAVATGAGDCPALAGAVPVAGTEAKARTNAANNAVFIRKEFTFIFHETAVQPTGQLNGRKRPK
jgi:hypothetical protein